MSDEKPKFEPGNSVALKVFPAVRMLVTGLSSYDERGFGGDWCICMWFNPMEELQVATLKSDWLELSGL